MRLLALVASFLFCFPAFSQSESEKVGLLVMAHGGSETWNAAIMEAVDLLDLSVPLSIAFGMVNPDTLQESINILEAQGVSSIRVVRLFISAESFLPETEFVFGLRETRPTGHFMFEPRVLEKSVPVTLNSHGLLDAAEVGSILADRAANLSTEVSIESVLIIGHGPGDDDENERWLTKMDSLADSVRLSADYHSVQVATIREDWTVKRVQVEEALRQFVIQESDEGRTVIVIPFRLFGFGPYAEVLDGLSYTSDGLGILPDFRITKWIRSEYEPASH